MDSTRGDGNSVGGSSGGSSGDEDEGGGVPRWKRRVNLPSHSNLG